MNLLQCEDKIIKLLNFYSISGNIISKTDSNYLDYSLRFRVLTDTAQKEIATTAKKIRKLKHIAQNPIPSQLINPLYSFDIVQHLTDDITYSATGSRAYTFKVDNPATIYIEEQVNNVWGILQVITHTSPLNEFTEYKGLITPSSILNSVRIRFSGNYVYNIRDIALFAYTFSSPSTIPQYQKYNLYTMPDDFYQLNKVIFKGSPTEGYGYNPTSDFYWEKRNVLAVNYNYKGEFTIDYSAYPSTIDDNTVETYEFEIDLEAQEAIPYYVASMMMMHENPSIGNKLYSLYQGKLANLDDNVSNGAVAVSNTLFSNSINRLF